MQTLISGSFSSEIMYIHTKFDVQLLYINASMYNIAVKLLLKKLREQTAQGLIQRRQKLIATLNNVS